MRLDQRLQLKAVASPRGFPGQEGCSRVAVPLLGATRWPTGRATHQEPAGIGLRSRFRLDRLDRRRDSMHDRWHLQEAKQRFSELILRVQADGPQFVTKHGEEVAVVVSIASTGTFGRGAGLQRIPAVRARRRPGRWQLGRACTTYRPGLTVSFLLDTNVAPVGVTAIV